MTLGDRVRQCRLALNWSQAELARRLDVKQQSIDQLEAGKVKSPRYVIELADALNVPLEWLRHGKGKMRFAQSLPGGAQAERSWTFEPADDAVPGRPKLAMRGNAFELNDHAYCLIAPYSADATGASPPAQTIFSRSWLKDLTPASPDELAVLRVSGDAMEPTLHGGDEVLVDRTAKKYIDDGLYVVRYPGTEQSMVKRLVRHPASGLLIIKSDNGNYGSQLTMSPADVAIEGRVIWIGKAFR